MNSSHPKLMDEGSYMIQRRTIMMHSRAMFPTLQQILSMKSMET